MSTLLFFLLCSMGWGRPPQAGKTPTSKEQIAPVMRMAQELRSKLAQPVNLEKGIDANTPLRDAIEFISQRFNLPIIVNSQAFKEDLGAVGDAIEDLQVRLPQMVGIKLSTVLRMLASQVGGTILVHGDHVEITTMQRPWPLGWQGVRQHAPTVDADFANRPLSAALRELSDDSGVSIILDGTFAEQGKTTITATFSGVPIDTAVDLLANMVGLKMVVRDRALYITSKEKAADMEAEKTKLVVGAA
jgi:hypothetical protein